MTTTTRPRSPLDSALTIALAAASISGLTIVLAALGWIDLVYSAWILAPLSAVVFVGLLTGGRAREAQAILVDRLVGGIKAGAAGLVAYDLVRLAVRLGGVSFNPFRPIELYGLLLLGRVTDTGFSKGLGWAFHVWNGLSFACMYTLAAGRGRVGLAVVWAMVLEGAMLAAYPSLFGIARDWRFVVLSCTGHLAYGLTVGYGARRWVTA